MQAMLFKDDCQIEISKNLRPKLELMNFFYVEASRARLGVNFSVNKYFITFSKKTNIFIQHYIPQSEFDKAPVKD